jgi:hypothetical protein
MRGMDRRAPLSAPALVAIGVAALWLFRRAGGADVELWADTAMDEGLVRACLDRGQCPAGGMGSSVPPFLIGMTWSHLRATLEWLGLGLPGVQALFQVCEALMVVLVAATADRVAGRMAAIVAPALAVTLLLHADYHLAVVYNSRTLPFLGAVVAGLAVVASEGARVPALLAAGVAGVMTNLHPVCGLLLPSVVAVAAIRAQGRWPRTLAVATVFGVVTFLASPASWVRSLLGAVAGGVHPVAAIGEGVTIIEWAAGAATAGAALAAAMPARPGFDRRAALAVAALLVPQVATVLAARALGIAAGGKYLLDLLPAIALGLAVAIAVAARPAGRLLDGTPAGRVVPYLLAAGLAAWPVAPAEGDGIGRMRVREAEALVASLPPTLAADEAALALRLRGPEAADVLDWVHVRSPAIRATGPEAPGFQAIAIRVAADRVPDRLPDGWRVAARDARSAVVLGLVPTRLGSRPPEACGADGQTCTPVAVRVPAGPEGAVTVDGLPRRGEAAGTVTLRWRLDDAPEGTRTVVHLPSGPRACEGRIASTPPYTTLSRDGRDALLVAGEPGVRDEAIVLRYEIGSAGCPAGAWSGLPPFLVEAPPGDAAFASALLGETLGVPR